MCEPVTLALASAALTAISVDQQQKSQASALKRQSRSRAQEEQFRATQQVNARTALARKEKARFRVAAGEAGISGRSLEAQQQAADARANRDASIVSKQLAFNVRAINDKVRVQTAGFQNPLLVGAAQAAGSLSTVDLGSGASRSGSS